MKNPETSLHSFKEGVLCYVVLRNYKGKGPLRWIMHEAEMMENKEFGYGHKRHWVVSPAAMLGMTTSQRKKMASRLNGKKGGRPKKAEND